MGQKKSWCHAGRPLKKEERRNLGDVAAWTGFVVAVIVVVVVVAVGCVLVRE